MVLKFFLLFIVLLLTTLIITIQIRKRFTRIKALSNSNISDMGIHAPSDPNMKERAKIRRKLLFTIFKNTNSIKTKLVVCWRFLELITSYILIISIFINISTFIIILTLFYVSIAFDQLFTVKVFYNYWQKATSPKVIPLSPSEFQATQKVRYQLSLLYFALIPDFLGFLYFFYLKDLILNR